MKLSRSTPSDTICAGTPVTYTATATGGGTSPQYVFRKNGTIVSSGAGSYTDRTPASGDVVSVSMISSLPCVTQAQTTDSIRMVVIPTAVPGVNINTTPPIILCAGTSVSFITNITGGGTNPTYQWFRNGLAVPGVTSANYTTASLSNGDTIEVRMASTAVCRAFDTAVSNKIGLSVTAMVAPSVSILADPTGPYVPGAPVTFTLSQSGGGPTPSLQWLKNGVVLPGETSATYTSASLRQGDQVGVRMLSSLSCASPALVTSNIITMRSAATGISGHAGSWDGTVTLYPNPTGGHFTVRAERSGRHTGGRVYLDIVSVVGQRCYHTELQPDRSAWSHEVWLPDAIADGTYMLRLTTDDGLSYTAPFSLKR